MTKAFISYSWDDEAHKEWVRELATRLRSDGIDVTLDQWDLAPGDQLPQFMERAVRDSDFVLIVCTSRYKQRSERRTGGVGYEGDIMTGEVLTAGNQRKFIPILRTRPWIESAPSWLAGKYYIDLADTPYSRGPYGDLLATLRGERPQAPPIGGKTRTDAPSPGIGVSTSTPVAAVPFEPIIIVGVVVDQVGTPRDDGTRGSGLYRVPFRLSRRPPPGWGDLFVKSWNSPPEFTTMHRPGIAAVIGEMVILDGTTVEEVELYHRRTLILAVAEANREYAALEARRQDQEDIERQRIEQHRRSVEDAARRIEFNT